MFTVNLYCLFHFLYSLYILSTSLALAMLTHVSHANKAPWIELNWIELRERAREREIVRLNLIAVTWHSHAVIIYTTPQREEGAGSGCLRVPPLWVGRVSYPLGWTCWSCQLCFMLEQVWGFKESECRRKFRKQWHKGGVAIPGHWLSKCLCSCDILTHTVSSVWCRETLGANYSVNIIYCSTIIYWWICLLVWLPLLPPLFPYLSSINLSYSLSSTPRFQLLPLSSWLPPWLS